MINKDFFIKNKYLQLNKKNILIWCICFLIAIIFLTIIFIYFYLESYYRADSQALTDSLVYSEANNLTINKDKNYITILPQNYSKSRGFIFYQGGKVEEEAYIPILTKLAKESSSIVVIPRMPFNLAILDSGIASKIVSENSEIENWTLMGHSLGGSSAAIYISNLKVTESIGSIQCIKAPCPQKCVLENKIDSLVLMASYSSSDISRKFKNCFDTPLKVISIYGSKDNILSKESYIDSKKNLPSNFKEIIIEGMNHSQFGNYGKQENDSDPNITYTNAQMQVVDTIIKFINQ